MTVKQVFLNGEVITMNSKSAEATAFGIIGDRFWAVGSDDEIRKLVDKKTKVTDLKRKTVIPGFIESHNHISEYATNLLQTDCNPNSNRNIDDVKKRIREMAEKTEPGQWVKGWGYDDTLISEKRHLTRNDLDEVTPDQPVYISHISGHLAYVNSKALEIAGISPETPQPDSGKIHKDDKGVPTGLLLEPGAINLVSQHIPSCTVSEFKEVLPKAIRHYHQFGITGTHDAAIGYGGETGEVCQAYRELEAEGNLNLRVYLTIIEEQYQRFLDLGLGTGFGSEFLKLGCVKLFQDGSIQGLTAAISKGYYSKPDVKGELLLPQETLNGLVEKYHNAGLQIAIHANGDQAIESVLQALERAQQLHPRNDHRHMLIHCQLASNDHIRRMKQLGVIPSYFVNHVYYWGDRHVALFLGPERAQRIDPLGSSIKEGLMFSLHSDLPVTPVDPIFSIHNAVNRITKDGKALGPEERIPVLEALKAYTIYAAHCSFEENLKGSIEAGKLADFTILSDNLLTVPAREIKDIQVLATAVGGNIVYGSV